MIEELLAVKRKVDEIYRDVKRAKFSSENWNTFSGMSILVLFTKRRCISIH